MEINEASDPIAECTPYCVPELNISMDGIDRERDKAASADQELSARGVEGRIFQLNIGRLGFLP
jgi:hypothetical protein